MKKFLLAIAALGLLTPSATFARDRDGYDNHRQHDRENHHRNRNNSGAIIGGLIGGIILGGIISSQSRSSDSYTSHYYDKPRRYRYITRHREQYCVKEQIVDQYGDVYIRTTCQ